MGILHEIGLKHGTDKATFHKYLDFYEKHLPDRTFSGRLLEIGIMDGFSLKMWREYYPKAEIVGIDIHIRPEPIKDVTMICVNATDSDMVVHLGDFDIVLDDGSHLCSEQQKAFDWFYNNQLNKGGVFVMEDCHTSFMETYVDTSETTYGLMKRIPHALEYNGNKGQSISFIIPKV